VHVLLSPLGLGLLLALFAALSWRRLPRAARWFVAAFGLLLLVAMCPLGANALVWQLESRVPAAGACPQPAPDTIVVLSAGLEQPPADGADIAAQAPASNRRALAGIALWRRSPAATLVFAGGGPFTVAESDLLQQFAEQLGVPAQRIRREARSQTTWENAGRLRDLQPALPRRIWLVSSALHLPRALIAFRAHGFEPCAFAAEWRYLPPGGIGYFLPQSSSLYKSELALHELVGIVYYRWLAATAAR
jgi:uncharacterized SAM-binding protein YcdF (DUF218 family)